MAAEPTPKTFKRDAKNREMRIAKLLTAKEAIGKIEKDTDTYILTYGQFSLIDALVAILDQIGPAKVVISTWTAADAHLQRSAELVESSSITDFRLIVDRSFETRQPGYCYQMRKLFGEDCIRAFRTHAKFMLIRSDTHDIVVRTSMNLNENPRLENIEITESREFADWFQQIVDAIFSEVEKGQNRSAMLALDDIQDDSPFREISANLISRESLNEPEATHTIKKL